MDFCYLTSSVLNICVNVVIDQRDEQVKKIWEKIPKFVDLLSFHIFKIKGVGFATKVQKEKKETTGKVKD